LVYWRICQELRQARRSGDGKAEAAATYELVDLTVFTRNDWRGRVFAAKPVEPSAVTPHYCRLS
jgi:hypothetical protein